LTCTVAKLLIDSSMSVDDHQNKELADIKQSTLMRVSSKLT